MRGRCLVVRISGSVRLLAPRSLRILVLWWGLGCLFLQFCSSSSFSR